MEYFNKLEFFNDVCLNTITKYLNYTVIFIYLFIGLIAAYYSWIRNSNIQESFGLKIVYALFAFLAGPSYLSWSGNSYIQKSFGLQILYALFAFLIGPSYLMSYFTWLR